MRCEEAHNLRGGFGIILDNENAAECACHGFPILLCLNIDTCALSKVLMRTPDKGSEHEAQQRSACGYHPVLIIDPSRPFRPNRFVNSTRTRL
jgi:hypothetical protein